MPDPVHPSFEDQYWRETLQSERLRSKLLAATSALLLAGLLLARASRISIVQSLDHAGAYPWLVALATGLLAYELVVHTVLGKMLRSNRRVPLPLRYWNSFLEVSVPSAAIIIFARTVHPLFALLSLAPSIYFLFIILSTLRLDFGLSLFTGAIAAVEYVLLAAWLTSGNTPQGTAIEQFSFVYFAAKGALLLIAGFSAGFVTEQIKKRLITSLKTIEERNSIIRMFGEHVAPAVVQELLNNSATTSSTRKYVSVMFVDIRGYTAFAERHAPEEVVAYLNSVFEVMIESVNAHNGIVHQLLGDGLMAIFGAPLSRGNDAENAVRAGLKIIEQLGEREREGRIPHTRVGIGIHSGDVLAGTVGTSLHKEYKVTGDVVNLAARIEQLNKEFGSQLLISGEVRKAVDGIVAQATPLGPVTIKGRKEPVEIFQLV